MKAHMRESKLRWVLGCALLVSCGGGDDAPVAPAPDIALVAPANLASGLTGNQILSAIVAGNAVVAGVEFQVDGTRVGSEDTTAPYQVSIDTSAYAAGQHVVRARSRTAAGGLSAWSTATVSFGGTASAPQGFTKKEDWVAGLTDATAFVQASDGRFFIAEQGGTVRAVKDGVLLPAPALTLAVDSSGERGVIGVTLHQNFTSNGFMYVHYTTADPGTHNRISRFTVINDLVSANSEFVLADLPALSGATNHNGGAIHFGIDGMLYVGVGENADAALAQDLSSPLGKLLRFHDDGSIPSGNPFCTTAGQLRCAVWAYGLRNPFTFAVQPGTGRIHINDVGQNTWEEINLGAPGANYGWPNSEGPDGIAAGFTPALFAYNHNAASPAGSGPGGFFTGFAISGGTFYPATGNFPVAYRGNYFFADFVNRYVGRVDLANDNAAYAFASLSGNPVDMLVGLDGALYVLTRGAVTRISAP